MNAPLNPTAQFFETMEVLFGPSETEALRAENATLKAQLAECRADLARSVEANKDAATAVLRAWREIRGSQAVSAPRRKAGLRP